MTREFFVHESAYVDQGTVIGVGTRIWHFSHISEGARIGANCTIGQNVFIGRDVVVGNGAKIQNNVSIYERVTLEDEVFCGPSCVFTNVMNPRAGHPTEHDRFEQTLVRRGCTIGANATIICGTTLGIFSFVGAGAVVTHDVPDYGLVFGNPASIQGWVCECGTKLVFKGTPNTSCLSCGRQYYISTEGALRRA